ncbi:MAG: hypothetical protein WAW52_12610 [Methanothrix sp.]
MKLDGLKKRLAALEPAPSPCCGLEALNDAELDAKIKDLIQRAEQRGTVLDFLHKELTCDGCTGNNRIAWCYSWKENGELQICSPRAAGA